MTHINSKLQQNALRHTYVQHTRRGAHMKRANEQTLGAYFRLNGGAINELHSLSMPPSSHFHDDDPTA